jgi:hypothetical protein
MTMNASDSVGVRPWRRDYGNAVSGRGVDLHVDRSAASTAHEAKRVGGGEYLLCDRRSVDDEDLDTGHPVRDLARVALVLADGQPRPRPRLVELDILELVRPGKRREAAPEHIGRHERIAHNEDPHCCYSSE